LFDYSPSESLINQSATITFHKRMRDELQLDGAELLKNQLQKDKAEIEQLIY
jgi:FAD synthase